MSDVKYIAEQKIFVVNGQIIRESDISVEQAEAYKKLASGNWKIINDHSSVEKTRFTIC